MSSPAQRELARLFRSQHGIATRGQLYAAGISAKVVRATVASGQWQGLRGGLVRVAASTASPEQRLMACILAGGPAPVASHVSASWLWRFGPEPGEHHVSVPVAASARVVPGRVHRLRRPLAQVAMARGFPCTNPLRTMVDLAAWLPATELDAALDKALAARLVSVGALRAELARVGAQGRRGITTLRSALRWRQEVGAGQASVLESMTLRLLHRAGTQPQGTEVAITAGEGSWAYRLDILLQAGLAMEVDGYSYHHSPAQMAGDARRRNRLDLAGLRVLVYTWRDIAYDGARVVGEVRAAMAQAHPASGEGRTLGYVQAQA